MAVPPPILYRPSNVPANVLLPLVIGMHASGGSPTGFDTNAGWTNWASTHPVCVVLPASQTSPAWLDLATNFTYLKTQIPLWVSQLNADPNKVFLTGFSAGSDMTLYIVSEGSIPLGGAAPVSGWNQTSWTFSRTTPMPMLSMIGSNDIGPASNGTQITTRASSLLIAGINGCANATTTVTTTGVIQREVWPCNVEIQTIIGGTHVYPGAPGDTGADAQVNATNIIGNWILSQTGTVTPPASVPIQDLVGNAAARFANLPVNVINPGGGFQHQIFRTLTGVG